MSNINVIVFYMFAIEDVTCVVGDSNVIETINMLISNEIQIILYTVGGPTVSISFLYISIILLKSVNYQQTTSHVLFYRSSNS